MVSLLTKSREETIRLLTSDPSSEKRRKRRSLKRERRKLKREEKRTPKSLRALLPRVPPPRMPKDRIK